MAQDSSKGASGMGNAFTKVAKLWKKPATMFVSMQTRIGL